MNEHYYDPVEIWSYEEREGAYKRIAELAAFVDKLIETGAGMYEQINMLYGDGMMSAYIKSMHDWNALVTEWRNREVE